MTTSRLILTVFLLAASLTQSAATGMSQGGDICALIPDVDKAQIEKIEINGNISCTACFDRDEEGRCLDSITVSYLKSEESAQDLARTLEGEGCEIGADGEILRAYTEKPLGDLAFYCADDSGAHATFQQITITKGPYLIGILNHMEREIEPVGEAIIARIEALVETGDAQSEEGEEQGEAEAEKNLLQALRGYETEDLLKVLECPDIMDCATLARARVTSNDAMQVFNDLVTDPSKPLSKEAALFWANAVGAAAIEKPDGKPLFPAVKLGLDIMGQMAWTAAESENQSMMNAAGRFMSLLKRLDTVALDLGPEQ